MLWTKSPRLKAIQLTVVRSGLPLPTPAAGELVVSDDEVRGWVRDGRLFVAPRAGHDLTNEQPELCATALLGFYRSTEDIARARARAVDAVTEVPS